MVNMFQKTPVKGIKKVESLQQKSANAMVIFKTTVQALQSVNTEITSELEAVSAEKIALKERESALIEQSNENQGFISKINEFLGVKPE